MNSGPDTELSWHRGEQGALHVLAERGVHLKLQLQRSTRRAAPGQAQGGRNTEEGHSSSCAGAPAFGKVFCAERWVLSWGVKVHQPTDLRPGFFHTLPLSLAKLIQPRVSVSWIASPKTGIHKQKRQGRNTTLQRTWVLYEKPRGSLTGREAVRVRDQAARAGVWRCHFLPRLWPNDLSFSPVKWER